MRISVITAVYNNRDTITDALDSVLAQSHPDVELIVIDGGSTDGTLETLHSFQDRISRLVSEPDQGIYDALNKGIQLATGDVVGFLHADDVFADADSLARIASGFVNDDIEAVYGDLLYVMRDDPEQVVRYWKAGMFSLGQLRQGWMPPHPTFYARRSLYERLGVFDTSYRIAADYECMLRFLRSGIKVVYVPQVLVRMRLGGASNRSLKNILRKSLEDYRVLKANKIGGMGALLWKNFSKFPQFFKR